MTLWGVSSGVSTCTPWLPQSATNTKPSGAMHTWHAHRKWSGVESTAPTTRRSLPSPTPYSWTPWDVP
jgi:hypothetical protein